MAAGGPAGRSQEEGLHAIGKAAAALLLEAPATSSVNTAALATMHGCLIYLVDYSNLIWSSNAVVLGANWPSNLSLERIYILDADWLKLSWFKAWPRDIFKP